MQCPSCNHENPEGQKFCGECGGKIPAPGPRNCPSCGHENPPSQKFCGECGTVLAESQIAAGSPGAKTLASPPAQKRSTGRAALPRGERKVVTVLFADVSGFTAMSEKLDPEEVTLIMNRCFDALGAPIAKHDGVIDKFIGDCVMALFGAPVAHEDDPERACRAALEMHAALSELNEHLPIPLAVNIGVNSGMVVAGEVGTEGKKDYTVMGDAVNTAQRIQSAAKGGQIYVSASVHRQTKNTFDFEELPPIKAKGKEHPVAVYRLKGYLREERGAPRIGPRTPLIGREKELALVADRLERALEGEGAVLALVGEAGIGKTRLRSETTRRAAEAGFAVVIGRGFDHRKEVPLGPALELVRRLFGVEDTDGPEETSRKIEDGLPDVELGATDRVALAADLGARPRASSSNAGPDESKAARFAPYLQLFRALASRSPALVVIEDLHWADPLTLELLSLVADETAGRPLIVMMTSRPGQEIPKGLRIPAEAMGLEELPFLDSRRLLHHLLGGRPIEAGLEEAILRRSEGNPFFLEELVFSLGPAGAAALQTLPDTVQAVVAARVDRLGEEAKWILQSASVLGRNFSVALLEAVAERDDIAPLLEQLEREALIYERTGEKPPSYSFRQAITQEVAQSSLLKQTARPMHLRAARGIETLYGQRLEERYSELAHHFFKGGDLVAATEYTLRAAEADRRAFALEKAEELFTQALESIEALAGEKDESKKPPLRRTTAAFESPAAGSIESAKLDSWRLTAHFGLGEIRRIHGQWESAGEQFESAVRLARKLGQRIGPAENALCRLAFLRGDFDDAKRRGEAAIEAARTRGDVEAEAEAANLLGNVAERQGRVEPAQELLRRAASIFHGLANPRGEAWALADLGTALLNAGRIEEALKVQRSSLDLKRGAGDRLGIAASLVNIGNIQTVQKQFPRALESFGEALETYSVVGDRRGVASTLINIATLQFRRGQLDDAERQGRQALELLEALGDVWVEAIALVTLGGIARWRRDVDGARRAYDRALKIFEARSYRYGVAAARGNLGEIALEVEDYDSAIEQLESATTEMRKLGDDVTARDLEMSLAASEVLGGKSGEKTGWNRFESLGAEMKDEKDPARLAVGWLFRGVALARSGREPEAAEPRRKALELANESGEETIRLLVERLLPLSSAPAPGEAEPIIES